MDKVSKGKNLVSNRGFRRTTIGRDGVPTRETTLSLEGPTLADVDIDPETQSLSECGLTSSEESAHEYEVDSIPTVAESPESILEPTSPEPTKTKTSKKRYILFFGNLPFDSTTEEIMTHFERRGVPIKDLRLLTNKETGKSRGCAFADFESNKTMQNALKFHRSRFKGKRINIEVTCGGGGSKENRKERIRDKNRTHRRKVNIKQGKYFKKI